MFTPDQLEPKPVTKTSCDAIIKILDEEFKKLVKANENGYGNEISISHLYEKPKFGPDPLNSAATGQAMLKHQKEIEQYYLSLGWAKVDICRAGIDGYCVQITLYKVA